MILFNKIEKKSSTDTTTTLLYFCFNMENKCLKLFSILLLVTDY